MDNSKPYSTPMSTSTKLDKDERGKCVDSKLYRSMMGSLLYLTACRLDIMFTVFLCARYQSCPKESHLLTVKRIFRYLKDTPSLGLWYPKVHFLLCMHTQMLSLVAVNWIEKAPSILVNY